MEQHDGQTGSRPATGTTCCPRSPSTGRPDGVLVAAAVLGLPACPAPARCLPTTRDRSRPRSTFSAVRSSRSPSHRGNSPSGISTHPLGRARPWRPLPSRRRARAARRDTPRRIPQRTVAPTARRGSAVRPAADRDSTGRAATVITSAMLAKSRCSPGSGARPAPRQMRVRWNRYLWACRPASTDRQLTIALVD